MKKCGLILLVVMMMLLSLMPAIQAQDDLTEDDLTDEERDLIEYVSDAISKLNAMNSVYTSATQSIVQDIRAQGERINQTITQDITAWILNEGMLPVAMDATTIQSIATSSNPGQDVELELSMDMRLLDDVLYVRVYDYPAQLNGFYPDGWVNLIEAGDRYQGFQLLNVEQLSNVAANSGIANIYNENTVLGIEELETETLEDGTDVRVFSVELDALAVMQDETTASAMSILNFESLGIDDVEAFMEDMMDSVSYVVTIQVDAETDIVLQTEVLMNMVAEITIQGISVDLIQDVTSTYTYSRFNEEIEIIVPDLSDA